MFYSFDDFISGDVKGISIVINREEFEIASGRRRQFIGGERLI